MLTIEEITSYIESTYHFKRMKDRLDNPPITALERYLSKPAGERTSGHSFSIRHLTAKGLKT